MRRLSVLACLFAAGVLAAHALAKPQPGKDKPRPTTTIAQTGGKSHDAKLVLCHRTGSKAHPYVKVVVAASALAAHLRHGDVRPLADGSCPKLPAKPTTTANVTTTRATTTTSVEPPTTTAGDDNQTTTDTTTTTTADDATTTTADDGSSSATTSSSSSASSSAAGSPSP